jgi:hypothetical protein
MRVAMVLPLGRSLATQYPGGGGARLRFETSRSKRLSNTNQITIWVNDGKLSHAPRLGFERILTWNALSRQPGCASHLKIDMGNPKLFRHPDAGRLTTLIGAAAL